MEYTNDTATPHVLMRKVLLAGILLVTAIATVYLILVRKRGNF